MTVDLATAPWGEVVIATAIFGFFIVGFWWLTRLGERQWLEYLQRNPLGLWNKLGGLTYVRGTMFVGRVFLLIMAVLYVLALGRRISK